jgi:predicted nucleic acid-binding Zn ribbon protein
MLQRVFDAPGECPECGEELKKETCNQAIELYHKHVIDKNDDAYIPEDESEQTHINSLLKVKITNIETLDKNHDGYVYQCSMCGNEISDKPGDCPKCGMKMQKVELNKAKTNLQKYYNEHEDDSNDDAYVPKSKKK